MLRRRQKSLTTFASKISSELRFVIKALKIDPEKRPNKIIQKLSDYLINLKFFKKMNQEDRGKILMLCSKSLKYESHFAGECVFRQSQEANKFYILLEGTANVVKSKDTRSTVIKELEKGESFGERALMFNLPRSATVKCVTECHFCTLKKSEYRKILGSYIEKTFEKISKVLSNLPFTKGYSRNAIHNMIYYTDTKHFSKKQRVFKQGTELDEVYIIKSGCFELYKKLRTGSCNSLAKLPLKSIHVASLGTGELIGEENLSKNNPPKYTCVCSEPGEILVVNRESFFRHFIKGKESQEALNNYIHHKNAFREGVLEQILKVGNTEPPKPKPSSYKDIMVSSLTPSSKIQVSKVGQLKTDRSLEDMKHHKFLKPLVYSNPRKLMISETLKANSCRNLFTRIKLE